MSHGEAPGIDVATLVACNVHEIKNLVGQLTLAMDGLGVDSEPVRAARLLSRRVGERLVQMLTLYKMQGERLAPRIDAHCPADFVVEIAAEARALAGARLAVETQIGEVAQFRFFDRDLVHLALMSAVHNALCYARARIAIGAAQRDGFLVLAVEDDGGGFPQAVLDSQARAFADTPSKGTGLGLYFAEAVARAHADGDRRGRLAIANKAQGGTRFELWLP